MLARARGAEGSGGAASSLATVVADVVLLDSAGKLPSKAKLTVNESSLRVAAGRAETVGVFAIVASTDTGELLRSGGGGAAANAFSKLTVVRRRQQGNREVHRGPVRGICLHHGDGQQEAQGDTQAQWYDQPACRHGRGCTESARCRWRYSAITAAEFEQACEDASNLVPPSRRASRRAHQVGVERSQAA